MSIVGPSGCGKSTLFNILAGLLEPEPGYEIYVNGVLTRSRLGMIAYMPQRDLLLPWRTVLDNAILGLEVGGADITQAREKARALFPEFGLKGFESHYPPQLSGGMRQRVALMRTFLLERDIVLLDEPFGALDALTRSILQEWLLNVWSKFRRTILFITHDVEEAVFLSDRVLVMSARPGSIRAEITIDLPRPRSAEVVTTSRFTELKAHVLESVKEESLVAFQQQERIS